MEKVELRNIRDLVVENAKQFVATGALCGKKVIIFGANAPMSDVAKYLRGLGYEIAYVVDNGFNPKNIARFADVFEIQHPDVLKDIENKSDYYVLIASKHYKAMCNQLEEMGFDPKQQTVQLYVFDEYFKNDIPADKQITPDMLKKIQVDILDFFVKTCREKNLRFYLCGGTLLGAVRHQGYIPWDDDIDVYMPMPDYLEFIHHFEENDTYVLQNSDTCISPYMFTKLANKKTVLQEFTYPFLGKFGVNIDIFPSSGFPDDAQELATFEQECAALREEWKQYLFNYVNDHADEVQYKKMADRYYELMTRYPFDAANKVGYIITAYFEREMNDRSCFEKTVNVSFEGKEYPAMVGYDEYMTHLYGDYMKLPPENERVSKHVYKAWFE